MTISIILFSLFAFLYFRNKKKRTLSSFLYLVYSGSFLSSAAIIYFYEDQNILLIPSIYLLVILLLWFLPFNIKNQYLSKIQYHRKGIKQFSYLIITILLPSTCYYLYYSAKVLTNANLDVFRHDIAQNSILPNNIFNTIFSHLSPLYIIALIFFFLALRDRWSFTQKTLLFFSSLSFVFLTLAYAGRDGILFWFFNFFILYFIFKDELAASIKKKLILISSILVSGAAIVFFIITIARFSTSNFNVVSNTIYYTILYYGQQTENFSDIFYLNSLETKSLFPGIKNLFGFESFQDQKTNLYIQGAMSEYRVFGFFAKTLVWGYGTIGAFLVSVIFYGIMNLLKSRFIKYKKISILLIIFIFYQIPLYGVFYYRQGIGNMDISYIIAIVLCLIINIDKNEKKNIVNRPNLP